MTNNIFNKAENNTFFIKINNEVYEMRFENIILDMANISLVSKDVHVVDITNKGILAMRMSIASIGEVVWNRLNFNDEIVPVAIYKSVEDCIHGEDPIFKWGEGVRNLICTDAIESIYASSDEVLLDGCFWKGRSNPLRKWLSMSTWKWDGINAVNSYVKTKATSETLELGFSSKYIDGLLYDLVNEDFIMDENEKSTLYASKEECINSNFVKVHRF